MSGVCKMKANLFMQTRRTCTLCFIFVACVWGIKEKTESVVNRMDLIEKEVERIAIENRELKETCMRLQDDNARIHNENAKLLSNRNTLTHIDKKRAAPEIPVAFTALLGHDPEHVGIGQTVVFDKPLLNEGNHYNIHTGVFTVPREGLYMFYFVFAEGWNPHKLWLRLVVDGHQQDTGVADNYASGHDSQGGNMAILHLHPGDSVWVSTFHVPDVRIYGSMGFTSFSGVLLFEY